jgi:hypothetical protein
MAHVQKLLIGLSANKQVNFGVKAASDHMTPVPPPPLHPGLCLLQGVCCRVCDVPLVGELVGSVPKEEWVAVCRLDNIKSWCSNLAVHPPPQVLPLEHILVWRTCCLL